MPASRRIGSIRRSHKILCEQVPREVYPDEALLASRVLAREVLLLWKDDSSTVRPHSGLGNLTPAAYADRSAPDAQRDGTLRYTEGSAPRRNLINRAARYFPHLRWFQI